MPIDKALLARSHSSCELCNNSEGLDTHAVPPESNGSLDQSILLCGTCLSQIQQPDTTDVNHWRCLNDSMWSQVPAVQVMAWRQLKHLSDESWAQDLLEMLYLDEETKTWAEATQSDNDTDPTLDSNGAVLEAGDTVTLIKDLVVKGANFTAKRGTAVRGISLTNNPEHIEGKVNGTRIVLLTKFLKKSN